MRIKPALTTVDGEPWNDEFDDKTYRYFESTGKGGYFYEIYVIIDEVHAAVVITEGGVSIDFSTGGCIHTNMTPELLFPGLQKLEWANLESILRILDETNMEGKSYSAEENEALYEYWKKNHKDA